jgi:hypothetical protein
VDRQEPSAATSKQFQEIQIMVGSLDRRGEHGPGAEDHLHNVEFVEGAVPSGFSKQSHDVRSAGAANQE